MRVFPVVVMLFLPPIFTPPVILRVLTPLVLLRVLATILGVLVVTQLLTMRVPTMIQMPSRQKACMRWTAMEKHIANSKGRCGDRSARCPLLLDGCQGHLKPPRSTTSLETLTDGVPSSSVVRRAA
jgi:hypothetical protein